MCSRGKLLVEMALDALKNDNIADNSQLVLQTDNTACIARNVIPVQRNLRDVTNYNTAMDSKDVSDDCSNDGYSQENGDPTSGTSTRLIEQPSLARASKKRFDYSTFFDHDNQDEHFSAGSSDDYDPDNDTEAKSDCNISSSSLDDHLISPENVLPETAEENPMPSKSFAEKQEHTGKKKTRIRKRNPDLWKRRHAALCRARGDEYMSQNGKTVPAKTVNREILCACRLKCNDKVGPEIRESLFKEFYKLDTNCKNAFLFRCIVKKHILRVKKNAKKNRSASFKYIVLINGDETIVCKSAFCKIFSIGRKKIELIQKMLESGQSTPRADMRGKHTNRPHKMKDEVRQYVINHIKQFPSESSHYSRNTNPNRKYLSPLLSISKMYALYLSKCNDEAKPDCFKVKETTFRKIFGSEFNLGFGEPRSDTCSRCDSGDGNVDHVNRYKAAFELQRKDRNEALKNPHLCYITMDLQQTQPLPKISTSKAFYLRQIWFYNFGIHSISTNGHKSFFFTWTEDVANRGSDEISSCLLYFTQIIKNDLKDVDHLILWSDSCAGQNKNFIILCLHQFLILTGRFKIIDHKFPEVGHSYLDSDRDFGRIEKRLRKHQAIYTPEQYRKIIKAASNKDSVVFDMEHHFRAMSELPNTLHLINRKKNIQNEKVNFRDEIKWIRTEEYGSYLYKTSYNETEPFQKINLTKKNASVPIEPDIHIINEKTGNISSEKLENIKQQLPFIAEEHQWFYKQFFEEEDAARTPKAKRPKK